MVTANSVKFSSVSCKISPSTTGEPSDSTFDSKSLLFGLRSRQDCGNTIVAFVLLSVETIWAAKHHTRVHHYAKTSRWPLNPSPNTYMICFDACPPVREITWRDVTSRIRIFLNPQLFLSGYCYRPHAYGEFASKSGNYWIRSPEWKFLNPITFRICVDGRIRIFSDTMTLQNWRKCLPRKCKYGRRSKAKSFCAP